MYTYSSNNQKINFMQNKFVNLKFRPSESNVELIRTAKKKILQYH